MVRVSHRRQVVWVQSSGLLVCQASRRIRLMAVAAACSRLVLGSPPVTGGADAGDSGGLADGAFDAGRDCVAAFPPLAVLAGPQGGDSFAGFAGAQEQLPVS